MNDGLAIPKLGLVADTQTTTREVENALDAGVAHIRARVVTALRDI
jgi:hypothetical protein